MAALRAEEEEDETGRQGHLGQLAQVAGLAQPDEGHHLVPQAVQLPYQDVGCLGSVGNLPHEVHVQLWDVSIRMLRVRVLL